MAIVCRLWRSPYGRSRSSTMQSSSFTKLRTSFRWGTNCTAHEAELRDCGCKEPLTEFGHFGQHSCMSAGKHHGVFCSNPSLNDAKVDLFRSVSYLEVSSCPPSSQNLRHAHRPSFSLYFNLSLTCGRRTEAEFAVRGSRRLQCSLVRKHGPHLQLHGQL